MKGKRKNRGGFSLAEAMLAVVVLAVAAAGILLPFSSGARVRAEGMHRTLGTKLACDLMERIVDTPFEDVVTTFDGYSEAEGEVKDASGAVLSDSIYARFSREASCSYVYLPQESGDYEARFILATVRVSYAGREVAIINRLIGE